MPASILFVAGDADVQRGLFAREGRAYWSAGFEALLEKHGILDYERRGFAVLDEPATLAAYPLLLLAWIPPWAWRAPWAAHLRDYPGALVLEGPLPAALAAALGLRQAPATRADASLRTMDPTLRAALAACPLPTPSDGQFALAPKRVCLRPPVDTRWPAAGCDPADTDACATQLARTAWSSQVLRLRRARPYAEPSAQLATLAFLLAHPRGLVDEDRELARAAWRALDGASLPPHCEAVRRAVGAALGEGGDVPAHGPWSRLAARWRGAPTPAPAADLTALAWQALAVRWWGGAWHAAAARRLCAQHLDAATQAPRRPLAVLDVHRLVLALAALGEDSAAHALYARLLACAFDGLTGAMRGGWLAADGFQSGRGALADPLIALTALALAGEREPRDALAGYAAAQCAAWEAAACDLAPLDARDGDSLVEVTGQPGAAALLRRGRALVWGFQALAAQVDFHTQGPLAESWQGCEPDDASQLEALWFAALDDHARACGVSYLALAPWPHRYRRALTLRHDVDRIPTPEQFAALCAWEAARGLRASWYWIHARLDAAQLAALVATGHEVGLHATALAAKPVQLAALRAAAGVAAHGESMHGGGGDFWRGHPSVRAACEAGLAYTEGVPSVLDFPYRFPALGAQGEVTLEAITCLTHNHSIDDGVSRKRRHVRDGAVLAARRAAGHYLVLLNHPDINFEAVRDTLAELATADTWCATAAEVADWWARSHRRDALEVSRLAGGTPRFELRAAADVAGLRVELRGAGARRELVVDCAAGTPRSVAFDGDDGVRRS